MRRLLLATIFLRDAAGAAMAIDFSAEVKTFDDKSYTDRDGKPAPQILGDIVESMLLNPPTGTSEEDKRKRFWLAHKIHKDRKDPVLTLGELQMIRKATFEYPVLAIAGQATKLVDPDFVDPTSIPADKAKK